MVSSDSAVGRFLEVAQGNINDLLANQGLSSDVHPHLAKLFSMFAFLGIYHVTRKVASHSKAFAKYCMQVTPASSKSLIERYGGSPQAYVMVLNTVDQLGNAYCHQLAALGFDIVLSGPPIDSERMERQASIMRERH